MLVWISLSALGDKKKWFLLHSRGEMAFQGLGSHFLWRSGDFLSSESHRKPVFLVDSIIDSCINVQEILEFVVAR